jgi:hypothetical protein
MASIGVGPFAEDCTDGRSTQELTVEHASIFEREVQFLARPDGRFSGKFYDCRKSVYVDGFNLIVNGPQVPRARM